MALITIGSLRSCAVTTTAWLLARRWQSEAAVLLAELDPAGGTLAAMLGRRTDPGLQSLAAASRRGLDAMAAGAHAQRIGANCSALLAPAAAEQVGDALRMLGDLEELFRDHDGDVIADCGRLDVTSPVLSFFGAGEAAIVVARAELADLRLLDASLARRGLRAGRHRLIPIDGAHAHCSGEGRRRIRDHRLYASPKRWDDTSSYADGARYGRRGPDIQDRRRPGHCGHGIWHPVRAKG